MLDESSITVGPGASVVVRGYGIGVVRGEVVQDGERCLLIDTKPAQVAIRLTDRERLVRRPVRPDEARRILALLRNNEPRIDDRPWRERHESCVRALRSGSLEAQALELQALYTSPYRPSFGETRLILVLEDAVLSELALVLNVGAARLVDELHVGRPVFSPNARERSEPPPSRPPRMSWIDRLSGLFVRRGAPRVPEPRIAGYDRVGSVRVERAIAAGDPKTLGRGHDHESEGEARASHVFAARGGTWHAFVALLREGRARRVMMVHESFLPRIPRMRDAAQPLVELVVRTGAVALVDATMREDFEAIDPKFAYGLIADRGCFATGPVLSGSYPLRVFVDGGDAVYVVIELV